MEPPSSPAPAGSSKNINVTPIHLNLLGLMASELLAAHEAEAQKSHAEALAAANMLDQIEEDLDGMKAKDLSRALALGVAMKALVKDWYNESLETVKQSTTIKPTDSTGATDARAPIYAKTAANSTNVAKTPAIILQKPLLRNNPREEKTSQILTHLPPDHLACKASSITTLKKLNDELSEFLTTVITAVQVIPTDIAIISRSLQDMEALLVKMNDVVINNYDDETLHLSAKFMTEEFTLQIRIKFV
ncbi:hypothetical protein ACO22_07319 [Paracoccidioides brasiliensis]|uniref:Uncharacterized protein n=1 Tax=Paracoccidioides brasiliensis TaxID=121759 RepID=A0A1D2J4Z2_PARBR|nr:hypothetical protein ACO22_07319 [Paracoccidioides brasiliensis]